MRKIEAIKKKGKYFAVTVDGEEYTGISPDAIAEFGLRTGALSEEDFEHFYALSDYYRCKQYVFDMIARKPRTSSEVTRKLKEKKFLPESINKSVALATEYGYLSDKRYAEDYVEISSRSKGGFRIKAELKRKGVSDEDIGVALESLTEEDEEECALRLARRKLRPDATEKDVEKAMRYLAARGISYEIARRTVRKLMDAPELFDELY